MLNLRMVSIIRTVAENGSHQTDTTLTFFFAFNVGRVAFFSIISGERYSVAQREIYKWIVVAKVAELERKRSWSRDLKESHVLVEIV